MEFLIQQLPAWAMNEFATLFIWQWICIGSLLLIGFIVDKIVTFLLTGFINATLPLIRWNKNKFLFQLTHSVGKLAGVIFIFFSIPLIEFTENTEDVIHKIMVIFLSVAATLFLHRLVNFFGFILSEKAEETEAKFDDIMVPLITKTSLIFVYAIGIILVAHSFGINVAGLVAGLGIGGLAFAFAAKDSLANLFGSLMIVLDRPFDIGDVVTAGDVEGTVISVGFRSTKVRTFYDSVISISNGELVGRSIDNKGKRRYRRLNTTLGLEYSTPPSKIEAFCEGIRQLILTHKWTRKDNFNVYFTGMGASSLDIQLMVFWETADYSRECSEKHRLLIDILRLAKELQVEFAFPTQTVHLFNEEQVEAPDFTEDKYLEEGIEKAKTITKKPLSLQNPRSNGIDGNQFGNNDVGL